jgi:cytochrome P450
MAALPTLRGLPLVGVLPQFLRNGAEFVDRIAREHGDLVHLRLGNQDVFLVTNPEWIKDVLVTHASQFKKSRTLERARVLLGDGLITNEGESHKRQRRLVQPAFHRDRLIKYSEAMVACAKQARERWRPYETFDIAREMTRMTLAIVARTLFSADVEKDTDKIGKALTQVFEMFNLLLMPFSSYLEKMPIIGSVRRFEQAREFLDATIYGMIQERRKSGEDKGDLLSMLLETRDEEGGAQMTDKQVHDEALTLFIAGHETTANALSWSWYLLAQNPTVEAKFHEELGRVLKGKLPRFEDLPQLKYTESVFAETLRLYPPAWTFGRRALNDYQIGDHLIPKGSILLLSPYAVQRDARWFPDPLKYKPERWLEEAPGRPKFAYFPFGGGPRLCIGERFAWTEGVLALATIGQKWRLRLELNQKVEMNPTITLRPKNGIRMIGSPR